MKFFYLLTGLFFVLLQVHAQSDYTYISPIPGSKFHSPNTSILLKTENKWGNFSAAFCKISGSVSGEIKYKFIFSEDKKTLILKPLNPFVPGEKVSVSINKNPQIKPFSFGFYISGWDEKIYAEKLNEYRKNEPDYPFYSNPALSKKAYSGLSVDINNNAAPGYIFIKNSGAQKPLNRYTLILDNNGSEVFSLQDSSRGYCFQLQPNGFITFFNRNNNSWEILDSNYKVIDTVFCANGYKADLHDFIITPDNHYILMSYDPQPVDMSQLVQGGNPDASVIGFVIQELDANKNLIFQWRSWDYFNITDAIHQDLTRKNIDYVHGNSLEIDNKDGNIIFSSRHLDELSKINRNTGDFIWRMGGVNNQFKFINDTSGFNYQHDARRLPNGNLTIYDNGNFHSPQISSVKEYAINEDSLTANLVWKYSHPDKIYARAMGNAQRLPGGNTWINWGLVTPGKPAITEVRNDGSIAFQATFNDSDNAYRSFKYQWLPKTNSVITEGKVVGNDIYYIISPNPVANAFSISGNFEGFISITDITGKEILSDLYYSAGSKINLSHLKPGIYIARLRCKNPELQERCLKIIKE